MYSPQQHGTRSITSKQTYMGSSEKPDRPNSQLSLRSALSRIAFASQTGFCVACARCVPDTLARVCKSDPSTRQHQRRLMDMACKKRVSKVWLKLIEVLNDGKLNT